MKAGTIVWAQFDSKGHPDATKRVNGRVDEVMKQLITWWLEVYMGTHLQIIVARSESELNERLTRRSMGADSDMLGYLESVLAAGNHANEAQGD